jgi:hypothetical protein
VRWVGKCIFYIYRCDCFPSVDLHCAVSCPVFLFIFTPIESIIFTRSAAPTTQSSISTQSTRTHKAYQRFSVRTVLTKQEQHHGMSDGMIEKYEQHRPLNLSSFTEVVCIHVDFIKSPSVFPPLLYFHSYNAICELHSQMQQICFWLWIGPFENCSARL